MKKFFTAGVFLSVLTMFSCVKTGPTGGPAEGDGSLSIRSNTNTDVIEHSKTRAVSTENFLLSISGPDGYSLERVLGTATTVSNLKPGDYTVNLTSPGTDALPAINTPIYQGGDTKEVTTGTKTIFNLTCTQINAGVKFVLDESVTDYFANLSIRVEDKEDASKYLVYTTANATNGDAAYFATPATLKVSLKEGDQDVSIGGETSVEIPVAAKEMWTVTLSTSSERPGSIIMDIQIDDSTTPKNPELGIGHVEGLGTAGSPYTISDAINVMPAQDVWIEGFITGSAVMTPVTRSTYTADNVLLGKTADAKPEYSVILVLPEDSELADAFNLVDHPENLGRKVLIKGNIASKSESFTSDAFAVVSGVSEFEFIVVGPVGKTLKEFPFSVGAALDYNIFKDQPAYVTTVKNNFNIITSEEAFSPMTIWKGVNDYDFTAADALVDFAVSNNMKVHASALVWPDATPEWVESYEGDFGILLADYITAVAGRYKGKIASWDAVRDIFGATVSPETGTYLTNNIWYEKLSGDYFVEFVFNKAHEADPDCLLLMNSDGLEPGANTDRQSEIYMYTDDWQTACEIPLHGISMRCSFNSSWASADAAARTKSITDAAQYGVLHLSADVNISDAEEQAQVYKSVFETYMGLAEVKRHGITTLGVADNDSNTSLLFDELYQPKEAYNGLLELIEDEE